MVLKKQYKKISRLPVLMYEINVMLEDAEEQYETLSIVAKANPGLIDNESIDRVFSISNNQKKDLIQYGKQLEKWSNLVLIPEQYKEIHELTKQLDCLKKNLDKTIQIASYLKNKKMEG